MTLSLRAHLLHEAKRLKETLKALLVQSKLNYPEVLFINTLEHFITCARSARAEHLKSSCVLLKLLITTQTMPNHRTRSRVYLSQNRIEDTRY